MPRFLIHHNHEPHECGVVFASFRGHGSPLRHRAALASCAHGGHAIWWTVEAAGPRRGARAPAVLRRRARHCDTSRRGRHPMTPELRSRPRRNARARRRLRGRVRRPRPRPPGRDDRQPGELHALHAAAARGRGRQHRAAPRDRAAAHDVPARRPAARLGRRARPRAQGRQRLLGGRRVRGRLRAAGDRARLDHAHAARARAAGVLARPQGHRRRDPPAQPRAAPDRARRRRPGERAAAADVRLRRRRLRGCRSRRRAPGTDRRCAPAASASRGCPAPLGLGRLGAAHPRAGAREPRARSPRGRSAGAAWRSSPQTALASIDRGGAVLSDGRRIDTETVVWTAGVAANPVAARLGLPLDERGRIPVDELFRVEGLDGVHALGDIAAVPNAATDSFDPPTCQHALRQARRLSRNLQGRGQAVRVQEPRLDGHARPPPRHRDRRGRPPARASSAGASRAATTCWRCPSTPAARACSRTGPPRPASAATSWSSRHEVASANCSCSARRTCSTTPAAASPAARWTSRSPTPTGSSTPRAAPASSARCRTRSAGSG